MAKKVTKVTRKKAMIEALEKSLGVVTTACKIVGIARKTHYEWIEKDPDYAEQVNDLKNIALDFAESQLHKRMQQGSDTAIIFYLKTQGKSRGYIEKQQHEHSGEVKTSELSALSFSELLELRKKLIDDV